MLPAPETYREKWQSWVKDPMLEKHGLTFDRSPAGVIKAPPGRVRVCAWHTDFDERPTCFLDVATADEARHVCENLFEACGWNVDFATAHDEAGAERVARPY
jgi:hypothetical protein